MPQTHITLRAETFAGRNFRVLKKTRNFLQKLSRLAMLGTNFMEKTFANFQKKVHFRVKKAEKRQKIVTKSRF